MTERDKKTVREQLGHAVCACSEDVTGGSWRKDISVITNTVLFTPVPRTGKEKRKQAETGCKKKNNRERTHRSQNKHLFCTLDDKFLNEDTTLHQTLYQRNNRDNISHQLLHLPEAFAQAAIPSADLIRSRKFVFILISQGNHSTVELHRAQAGDTTHQDAANPDGRALTGGGAEHHSSSLLLSSVGMAVDTLGWQQPCLPYTATYRHDELLHTVRGHAVQVGEVQLQVDLVVEHVLAERAAEHGLHRVLGHGVHPQPVHVGVAVLAVGTLVHLWSTQMNHTALTGAIFLSYSQALII